MKKLFLLLFVLSIIVSCDDQKLKSDNSIISLEEAEYVLDNDFNPPPLRAQKIQVKKDNTTLQRKFIKNGRVVFKTDSISKTKALITQLVRNYGGYISTENASKNDKRINQHITLRIPADQFDSFLNKLSKGVKEYEEKIINVSDVTERFYDLTSRLKNKRQLEKRYLQILNKAKTVKEILDVEREIGKLREDIESAEGRLKYLRSQISLSTLNITFYKEVETEVKETNSFFEAFESGIKAIKNFVLFLISVWPFVILSFIGYLVIRRRTKKEKTIP
tara:strand:- start:3858 stop:4688 length:831 start_codon:yes stop_codon:yes gene_type:complete